MEKKIKKLFVIVSILIVVILIAIGILYMNISSIYPPPNPSIDFEEDETSGNGWLNLTVTGLNYIKEINWNDLELRYNIDSILEGPKPLVNLMESEWVYSGEDDAVNINDKLYIHAKPDTTIYFVYVPSNSLIAHELEVS